MVFGCEQQAAAAKSITELRATQVESAYYYNYYYNSCSDPFPDQIKIASRVASFYLLEQRN